MMSTRDVPAVSAVVTRCNHNTNMVVASHNHIHVTTGVDKEGWYLHEPRQRKPRVAWHP